MINVGTPVPMWFVQAPLKPREMRRQIAAVKKQKYAGILPIIISPEIESADWIRDGMFSPEPYLSEAFFDKFDVIVEACRKHELKLWIWDDVYCPAGWAGGLLRKKRPDLESLVIRRRRPGDDTSGVEAKMTLCRRGDTVYELVNDGSRVDMYHPDSGRTFTEITYEAYYRRYAADFGTTIAAFFHDEPGTPGGVRTSYRMPDGYVPWPPVAWSSALPAAFIGKYGYDLVPHIPELWIDEPAVPETLRVRADFARLINEMWIRNWLTPIHDWCAAHKVGFIGHNNNDENVEAHAKTAGNLLASLKAFDVPGIDIVTGQIYPNIEKIPPNPYAPYNPMPYNGLLPRFASSAARQKGTGVALAEIGAVYGAGWSIRNRKWLSDYVFARGIQIHNIGGLAYSAAGNALFMSCDGCNSAQPYYPHIPELNQYLAETSALLCLGRAATRHAVWYSPATYETRQIERASEYFDGLLEYLEFSGIEPDVLGSDDPKAAALYDYIYLPANIMPDDVERRFLADACAHATIFAPRELGIHGAREYDSKPWDAQKKLLENALAVYGALGAMLTPDLKYQSQAPLRFHWRQIDENNGLVFIFNDSTDHDFTGNLQLTPAGDAAAIYVKTAEKSQFIRHQGNCISIPTESSCIVLWVGTPETLPAVIKNALAESAPGRALPLPAIEWTLTGAIQTFWDGKFATRKITPDEAGKLIAAQVFSGEIVYEGSFELAAVDQDARLTLADLKQSAEVAVNGRKMGTILWKPWVLVIPRKYLKKGANSIRLTVRNTLADYARSAEFIRAYQARHLTPDNYWKMSEGLDARVKGLGFRQAGGD